MLHKIKQCALLGFMLVALTQCDVIGPQPTNSTEVITTAKLSFVQSSDTTQRFVAVYKDADGAGGAAPTIDPIVLKPNTLYRVQVALLNESAATAINVSDEIVSEASDHQLFFVPSGVSVAVTYNDVDSKGNPVGLRSFWQTASAAVGSMKITLKHQVNKKPNAPGDISIGDTDIELNFATKVQ